MRERIDIELDQLEEALEAADRRKELEDSDMAVKPIDAYEYAQGDY